MKNLMPTRVAYGQALAEFGDDPRIVVLDADLASCTHNEVFANQYPKRFFNIGIAEANMVGIAAGLASTGKIAICASFAMFSAGKAFEQIRNSVAYPHLNVKIVGSHAGLTVGEDGATHQCLEDVGIMRTLPGVVVLSPCDANETREAVKAMLAHNGPCYLRTSRMPAPQLTQSLLDYNFTIGKAHQVQDGKDITICATGLVVHNALEAAKKLEAKGVSIRFLIFPTIKPLDEEAVKKAAKETKAIFVVEEHNIINGLGSAITEVTAENNPVKVVRIGVEDKFGRSGTPEELLDMYGLSSEKIHAKIVSHL